MKTFIKIIINAILVISFLFTGIACVMSFFIGGKYPKEDNATVFGALSVLFLLLFLFWDRKSKSAD